MERVRARTKALTLFFMFVVFAISATVAFTLGGKVFGWSEPVRLVAASTLGIIGMVFDFTAYVTLSNAKIRYDVQRAESAKKTEDQAAERLLHELDLPSRLDFNRNSCFGVMRRGGAG
jgi:uncharacterized membrane protein